MDTATWSLYLYQLARGTNTQLTINQMQRRECGIAFPSLLNPLLINDFAFPSTAWHMVHKAQHIMILQENDSPDLGHRI